jgi:hypothetical protein
MPLTFNSLTQSPASPRGFLYAGTVAAPFTALTAGRPTELPPLGLSARAARGSVDPQKDGLKNIVPMVRLRISRYRPRSSRADVLRRNPTTGIDDAWAPRRKLRFGALDTARLRPASAGLFVAHPRQGW